MIQEKPGPAVKHGMGDAEAEAEFFDRSLMNEVLSDDPEDEEDPIGTVRDDKIRKDRVGMSA